MHVALNKPVRNGLGRGKGVTAVQRNGVESVDGKVAKLANGNRRFSTAFIVEMRSLVRQLRSGWSA